ncbi:MAG: DUF4938 domain-containing protein [Roseiflexaceae bacterium]|nr:DUF4938 domain-containing protein [Roseiflexaceae bacterium]
MPISLIRLLAFDGPNRYSPQPGVFIQLSCDHDCSTMLRRHLKDAAQQVGIILAYLEAAAVAHGDQCIIDLHVTTPTPALGAAIGQYVIEALRAKEQGDEQWDAEEPLWLLQKRRRAEALPVAALQLLSEAAHRGIPAFQHTNTSLQIGYGSHGMAVPYGPQPKQGMLHPDAVGIRGAAARERGTPEIPWDRLGPMPLVAFSGHPHASAMAATAFQEILQGSNSHNPPFQPESSITLALNAGFDEVRTILANPSVDGLVVALAANDLATRGLPCVACSACAIIGLPDMPTIGGGDEIAQIVGLPILVTEPGGIVALDADTPAIAALSEYASSRIVFFSQSAAQIVEQRATGARVVFARSGEIIGAYGSTEQALATIQPNREVSGQLAAWALWWGLRDI